MDADDVALFVIFLKEMNAELGRCYNIILCQHEINKHLLASTKKMSTVLTNFVFSCKSVNSVLCNNHMTLIWQHVT